RGSLVVRTIVSSRFLDAVAAARGATVATTLTGFKHVMGAARSRPDLRFVFGYEEALGYAVGDDVRDKDGITAALLMADLVARLRPDGGAGRGGGGRPRAARRAERGTAHGLPRTESRSHRYEGLDGRARLTEAMAALRTAAPTELAGRPVREISDHLAVDDLA